MRMRLESHEVFQLCIVLLSGSLSTIWVREVGEGQRVGLSQLPHFFDHLSRMGDEGGMTVLDGLFLIFSGEDGWAPTINSGDDAR